MAVPLIRSTIPFIVVFVIIEFYINVSVLPPPRPSPPRLSLSLSVFFSFLSIIPLYLIREIETIDA